MAEALLRHKAAQRGIELEVDAAGTGGWHAGEEADHRTRQTLRKHGIGEPTLAREVTPSDFDHFDHIIAMDNGHLQELHAWPNSKPEKISLFLDWAGPQKGQNVPDPYYGGHDGFEHIYRLIDAGTDGILKALTNPSRP